VGWGWRTCEHAAVPYAEFADECGDVGSHGDGCDDQLLGDLGGRVGLAQQDEHIPFAGCQPDGSSIGPIDVQATLAGWEGSV
jgi:hypothetical protein